MALRGPPGEEMEGVRARGRMEGDPTVDTKGWTGVEGSADLVFAGRILGDPRAGLFPGTEATDAAELSVEGEERMGPEDISSLLAMLDGRRECDRNCLLGVTGGKKGRGGR